MLVNHQLLEMEVCDAVECKTEESTPEKEEPTTPPDVQRHDEHIALCLEYDRCVYVLFSKECLIRNEIVFLYLPFVFFHFTFFIH